MKTIYHMLILMGSVLFTSLAQGQVVLEALDKPLFTATTSTTYTSSVCRNNCPAYHSGRCVNYTASGYGSATSYESQEAANSAAYEDAQEAAYYNWTQESQSYANSNAQCQHNGYRCSKVIYEYVSIDERSLFCPAYSMPCASLNCPTPGSTLVSSTSYDSSVDETGNNEQVIASGECYSPFSAPYDGYSGANDYYTKTRRTFIFCMPKSN